MYLKSVSSFTPHVVVGYPVLPLALLTTELSHLASHMEDNSLHLQPPRYSPVSLWSDLGHHDVPCTVLHGSGLPADNNVWK